jgi:hypothetical protein
MGEKIIKDRTIALVCIAAAAFIAGLGFHVLYQRWNPEVRPEKEIEGKAEEYPEPPGVLTPGTHSVSFATAPTPHEKPVELPLIQARDVEKIREHAGSPARVRGHIFRVGHSEKSNTYFLNFGPSREALTAVIFASAVEVFEKNKLAPKSFDGREVEVSGEIKNHPQYGLEVILDNPGQIKILN